MYTVKKKWTNATKQNYNGSKIAKLNQSRKHRWKGGKQIPCSNCKKLLWITPYYLNVKKYKNFYCDKKCESESRKYGNNSDLKVNLKRRKENSYIYCIYNGKRYLQHRAVMEKKLGRLLEKYELVHHLNGVRTDNREENLFLVDNHNHERNTVIKIYQKRILDLENKLKLYVSN